MKFPLLGLTETAPSTTATNYAAICSCYGTWPTTESERQTPVSENCTITEFSPRLTTAPGAGKSYKFTIRKNGEDTAATVTIEGETTTATAWTGSVSLTAGDLLTVSCVPTGTPTASGSVSFYTYFQTTGQTYFLMGSSTQNASAASTGYMQPCGATGVAWETSTEANARMIVPHACTFTKLTLRTSGGAGEGKKYEVSGRLAASSDFLTVTAEGAGAVTVSATGTQAAAAGEALTLKCVPTGTPTARRMSWCFSVTPTTENESFLGFGWSNTDSTTTTQYNLPFGPGSTWTNTESSRVLYPPALTVRKFYVAIGTAPGESKSRTISLKSNGSVTAASVKLEGAAATSGNYTAGDVSITGGQAFVLSSTPSGTPAADTGGVHAGFVIANAAESSGTKPLRTLMGVGT